MPSLDDEDGYALKQEGPTIPPLIQSAISYCWSNGFLDVFRQYFKDNAKPFIGYPPKREMESAEHLLAHYELYQKYLELYEETLSDWLDKQGVALKDFYEEVKAVQNSSKDPKVQEFVYCLLASCDYDSFYSVMVREAMKLSSSAPLAYATLVPSKAESKDDAPSSRGSKGGDDDPKGGGGDSK
mmetsp:Transcript_30295/g.102181  ORF Transcript_30295/g.102181 Transcript_30295/m.102181 type:complete len:184 (+) Transcript_30295:93-644(+)